MGFYVSVWEYRRVEDDQSVINNYCALGWEPFAVTTNTRYGSSIVHLRRPTGRSVRVADDD